MTGTIKVDDASIEAALKVYADSLNTTVQAMESFVSTANESPYSTGNSAASSTLSSYMQGLSLDYLASLRSNLAGIMLTIPAAVKILHENDDAVSASIRGDK